MSALSTEHVFIAACCIHCGCDDHDAAADEPCQVPHEPGRWTFDGRPRNEDGSDQ